MDDNGFYAISANEFGGPWTTSGFEEPESLISVKAYAEILAPDAGPICSQDELVGQIGRPLSFSEIEIETVIDGEVPPEVNLGETLIPETRTWFENLPEINDDSPNVGPRRGHSIVANLGGVEVSPQGRVFFPEGMFGEHFWTPLATSVAIVDVGTYTDATGRVIVSRAADFGSEWNKRLVQDEDHPFTDLTASGVYQKGILAAPFSQPLGISRISGGLQLGRIVVTYEKKIPKLQSPELACITFNKFDLVSDQIGQGEALYWNGDYEILRDEDEIRIHQYFGNRIPAERVEVDEIDFFEDGPAGSAGYVRWDIGYQGNARYCTGENRVHRNDVKFTITGKGDATVIDDTSGWPVSIVAGRSTKEGEQEPGTFTVKSSYPGDDYAIRVEYEVDGSTADEGDDYETLSGEVTIDYDNETALIEVTAIDDDILEEVETVEITIVGLSVVKWTREERDPYTGDVLVEESFDEVREKMRQGIHRAAYAASYAASFGSSLIKDLVAEDAREGASAGEGAAKGDYSTFRTKIEEAIRPKGEDAGEVKEEEAQDTGETDDSEIFGTGAS